MAKSGRTSSLVHAARKAARAAALTYTSDKNAGIRRTRNGAGFRYYSPRGKSIRDITTLSRIKQLAIPPAWKDVWICPIANGHLQATGRDARSRKQYLYHSRWRSIRDENKFGRLAAFGAALPRLRRRVSRDLRLKGVCRNRVLATIIRLLEESLIRVGNEEYARANHSFGLTTLKNRHVQVSGPTMHFHFRGKSGKTHEINVTDPRVARIVKRCQELPGSELFEYLDDTHQRHGINSTQVNDYLREIAGSDYTAKDFRTWAGTLLAASLLRNIKTPRPGKIAKVIKEVAQQLGNTPSVCRKCYVHPLIISTSMNGELRRKFLCPDNRRPRHSGLRRDEEALLALLACGP